MLDSSKKRYRLRIIDPAYPALNIYSYNARRTTPLGPVCVGSAVNEMEGWDVEIITSAGMAPKLKRKAPTMNFYKD